MSDGDTQGPDHDRPWPAGWGRGRHAEHRPLADRLRPYLRDDRPAPPPRLGHDDPPPPPREDGGGHVAEPAPAPLTDPAWRPPGEAGPGAGAAQPPIRAAVSPTPPEGDTPTEDQTARQPSASAFSDDALLRRRPEKPPGGWRRLVHTLTAGKVSPGPSAEELAQRRLLARVRTPVAGCRRVAVISRKGGVGKTTTTLMLGHTFAAHRGDRVIALDGNPDAGSLGYRVRRETDATVTDLLDRADALERYADVRTLTSQSDTRLEVVASDDDPHISQAIGEQEYRAAVSLLERHYNLILLDTGTGILDSATQGILHVADQLVVVMAPSIDGARAASLTLDWLDSHGFGALVGNAVAVVNQSRERGSQVEIDRVEDHFRSRCREVVRIPWDSHLEAGAQSDLDQLRPSTRDAYLRLAAAVADGFVAARAGAPA